MKTTIEYGEELEKILYEGQPMYGVEIDGDKAIIGWKDVIRKTEIEIIDTFCNKNGLDWQLSSEGGEDDISEYLSGDYSWSNINIEIWIKQKKEN